MPDPDQFRREDLRRAVRHYLAQRATVAQDAGTIHRAIRRAEPCELREIEAALTFFIHLDPPQIRTVRESLGATLYYQITSAGVLADERE